MSGPERRQYKRIEVSVRVHVAELGEVSASITRDLSEGGLFLNTTAFRKPGSILALAIIDAERAEEIPLVGRVVRVSHSDGTVTGMAIQFLHLDDSLRERIRALLSRIPEPPEGEKVVARLHLKRIGGFPPGAVPQLVEEPGKLEPVQAYVLSFVDGMRSVDDIMRKSGLEVHEVLAHLSELAGRGVLEISDAPPTVETVSARPQEESEREEFISKRAAEYVDAAMHADQQGQLPFAVRLLQLALMLRPPDRASIHLRLAQLALYRLDDLGMADRHATAATTLDPDDRAARQLLEEIQVRRATEDNS